LKGIESLKISSIPTQNADPNITMAPNKCSFPFGIWDIRPIPTHNFKKTFPKMPLIGKFADRITAWKAQSKRRIAAPRKAI
jgi:hypothetical protein